MDALCARARADRGPTPGTWRVDRLRVHDFHADAGRGHGVLGTHDARRPSGADLVEPGQRVRPRYGQASSSRRSFAARTRAAKRWSRWARAPVPAAGSMGSAPATMRDCVRAQRVRADRLRQCRPRALTAAELLVPLSLALTIAVPFQTFRYVLPLTAVPVLLSDRRRAHGSPSGAGARSGRCRGIRGGSARIVTLVPDRIDLLDHAQYISTRATRSERRRSTGSATPTEIDEVLGWMSGRLAEGARS